MQKDPYWQLAQSFFGTPYKIQKVMEETNKADGVKILEKIRDSKRTLTMEQLMNIDKG